MLWINSAHKQLLRDLLTSHPLKLFFLCQTCSFVCSSSLLMINLCQQWRVTIGKFCSKHLGYYWKQFQFSLVSIKPVATVSNLLMYGSQCSGQICTFFIHFNHPILWPLPYLVFSCPLYSISIQDYLYSTFHDTIVTKQLYRELSFYNRFI